MFRRGRRLRTNSVIRSLVRENSLSTEDFIYPVFIVEGNNIKREIRSLKGNYHWSVDKLEELVKELNEAKVKSVILFGIPEHKDCVGSEAYNDDGIVQKAIRKLKELDSNLYIITDVCMCEYTNHGHCGILSNNNVDNDKTLVYLGEIALSHVKAGADMVAPSDMMDGRIGYIREVLDKNGFENGENYKEIIRIEGKKYKEKRKSFNCNECWYKKNRVVSSIEENLKILEKMQKKINE